MPCNCDNICFTEIKHVLQGTTVKRESKSKTQSKPFKFYKAERIYIGEGASIGFLGL